MQEVRWLLVGGDPRPTHGVDATGEPLERGGIASLEAHGGYLAGIPGHPPPMITGRTALQGRATAAADGARKTSG